MAIAAASQASPPGRRRLRPARRKGFLQDAVVRLARRIVRHQSTARVQGEPRPLGGGQRPLARHQGGGQAPARDVQQRREEFRQHEPIARAGREQTRGSADGQRKPVIGVALDISYEPKEFEVPKQPLVFTGIVAMRREHHLAGPVQHALGLRQIVALQQALRRGRLNASQHVLLPQIGIQPGAPLGGVDVAPQLSTERIRHCRERGPTALGTGDGLCGQGEDALVQFSRRDGTMHLEGAEGARQEVRQPSFQPVIGLVPLENLKLGLERASGPPLRRTKQRNQLRGQRQGVSSDGQPPGHDCLPVSALDQQLGG
jgi:hypothetical protein